MARHYTELSKNEEDRARQVHERSYVINGLTGFGGEIAAGIEFYNIMKQGGLTAVNYTVGSGNSVNLAEL